MLRTETTRAGVGDANSAFANARRLERELTRAKEIQRDKEIKRAAQTQRDKEIKRGASGRAIAEVIHLAKVLGGTINVAFSAPAAAIAPPRVSESRPATPLAEAQRRVAALIEQAQRKRTETEPEGASESRRIRPASPNS